MSDEGDDPASNSNIVDLSDEYITVEDLVLSVHYIATRIMPVRCYGLYKFLLQFIEHKTIVI
jgi:hypothetical protein